MLTFTSIPILFLILLGVISLVECTTDYPDPITTGGHVAGVDSPSMCKFGDTYYVFYTGYGVGYMTSTDRITWGDDKVIFTTSPTSTDTYTASSGSTVLWAPDCTVINDKFYVYYSASTFGSQHSGIFLATSTDGQSWTDEGLIVGTETGDAWNAIDPHLVIDGDDWYLNAGSWWEGINLFPVEPLTGKLLSTTYTHISDNDNGAEEAGWIFPYQGAYYLFTSFDVCCAGMESTYNIRVTKASTVGGPYVDALGVAALSAGGTEMLASHGDIYGPGGQSIFVDDNGDILLVYHHYTGSDSATSVSNFALNILDFQDGWPVVVAGDGNPLNSTAGSAAVTSTTVIAAATTSAAAGSTTKTRTKRLKSGKTITLAARATGA